MKKLSKKKKKKILIGGIGIVGLLLALSMLSKKYGGEELVAY